MKMENTHCYECAGKAAAREEFCFTCDGKGNPRVVEKKVVSKVVNKKRGDK